MPEIGFGTLFKKILFQLQLRSAAVWNNRDKLKGARLWAE